MKKCPYCAEDIQNEAIKCKHCGEMLNKERQRIDTQTISDDVAKIVTRKVFIKPIFVILTVIGALGVIITIGWHITATAEIYPDQHSREYYGLPLNSVVAAGVISAFWTGGCIFWSILLTIGIIGLRSNKKALDQKVGLTGDPGKVPTVPNDLTETKGSSEQVKTAADRPPSPIDKFISDLADFIIKPEPMAKTVTQKTSHTNHNESDIQKAQNKAATADNKKSNYFGAIIAGLVLAALFIVVPLIVNESQFVNSANGHISGKIRYSASGRKYVVDSKNRVRGVWNQYDNKWDEFVAMWDDVTNY